MILKVHGVDGSVCCFHNLRDLFLDIPYVLTQGNVYAQRWILGCFINVVKLVSFLCSRTALSHVTISLKTHVDIRPYKG